MKKPVSFLLTIHFHQPVGNFGFVIEKIANECYEPFLDLIAEFPEIKFNLHYSGSLLEWFKKYRPRILDKIKKLCLSGQIELVGGGFYEPVLSALTYDDARGQIKMLSSFIKDEFDFNVKGAWLAERVWEESLVEVLSDAGASYTILDDTHLKNAGLLQKDLYRYYDTEYNSKKIAIFGSDKFLRYSIPFMEPKKSIDYLIDVYKNYKNPVVLYGDDGEKFGAWPGTNKLVYKKKWLKKFLTALVKNSKSIKTMKTSDYLKSNPPKATISVPNCSYQEMNEWSLPVEAQSALYKMLKDLKKKKSFKDYEHFIKGGIWKNFFLKYPESNHIHKRTLIASERLKKLTDKKDVKRKDIRDATRQLYKSQCNCAYWHGIFGGIYFYHLRAELYKHLLKCEYILDRIELNKKKIDIKYYDFDSDRHDEVLVRTPYDGFVIDPEDSGSLTEWDIKEEYLNILNTLSRKKEVYHKNFKPKYKKDIFYDIYRRSSFIDHFLSNETTLNQLSKNKYQEEGDFAGANYNIVNKKHASIVTLKRRGLVDNKSIELKKTFSFNKEAHFIKVSYSIKNLSNKRISINFAPEMNFSITQDDIEETVKQLDSFQIRDKIEQIKIDFNFSKKADKIFRYPVYTLSQSQKDPEKSYQATCVIPLFNVIIDSNSTKIIHLELSVNLL